MVEEAKTWVNTPYHSMAKLKGIGVDCVQLLIGVYENCHLIEGFDTGTYSHEWHLHKGEERYLQGLLLFCDKVSSMKKGDILVYQYGRCISHAGIYIGDNQLIHAYVDRGVIISCLDDVLFVDRKGKSRYRGCYSLRGR